MNNVGSHLLIKCRLTPLGMLVGSLALPGFRNLNSDQHFLTGCAFHSRKAGLAFRVKKRGGKDPSRIIWEIMINRRPFYHLRYDLCTMSSFSMHRLYFLSHSFLTTPFFLDSRSKAVMSLFQLYSCKLIMAPSSEAQRSARRQK